jgi:hypothetical protein
MMEGALMHFPGGRDWQVRRGGLEDEAAWLASQLGSMVRP